MMIWVARKAHMVIVLTPEAHTQRTYGNANHVRAGSAPISEATSSLR